MQNRSRLARRRRRQSRRRNRTLVSVAADHSGKDGFRTGVLFVAVLLERPARVHAVLADVRPGHVRPLRLHGDQLGGLRGRATRRLVERAATAENQRLQLARRSRVDGLVDGLGLLGLLGRPFRLGGLRRSGRRHQTRQTLGPAG